MNRERFEELLPAWLDGELSESEMAQMESALAESPELRESAALSRKLEDALVLRRSDVPPIDRFIDNLAPAWGVSTALARGEHSLLRRWLDAIVSVPALAVMGFMMLGLWTFWHQDLVTSLFSNRVDGVAIGERFANAFSIDGFGRSVSALTELMPGGDMTLLIALYSLMTIAILAMTGVMTARFVRS